MKLLSLLIFCCVPCVLLFAQPGQKLGHAVAITFDDLPAVSGEAEYVIPRLIEVLNREQVPAIGFVNEGKLYQHQQLNQAQLKLLEQWLDKGFTLGNHSFSHFNLDKVTLDEYKADVLKGEKITKALLRSRNQPLKYYRHPQLKTGPSAEAKAELDRFLAEHQYTVAPVTLDNGDYIFARIYQLARQKGDTATMQLVANEYLQYMEQIFTHFEKLSQGFLGYNPKHILLLHANALNADHVGSLLAMIRKRGYRFITLEEALEDPAYQLAETPSKRGISWLHRWMLAKGLPQQWEPDEPKIISDLFKSYQ